MLQIRKPTLRKLKYKIRGKARIQTQFTFTPDPEAQYSKLDNLEIVSTMIPLLMASPPRSHTIA